MADRVLGAILAGGLARRMGGGDKPLRTIAGRTLLDHVVERLRPQCDALVLNANGDPARFARWRLPVIPDTVPDFAGPLAGILAALDHAAEHHPAWPDVMSVAADTPFLPPDLVMRLRDARSGNGAPVACAASDGRTHPVIALWSVAIRDELRRALAGGERKAGRITEHFGVAVAEWATDPVDPFFNANSPDDLRRAEAMLASLRA